jgi:tripartite-type tricarboxylate transporter receptor subunit TctC
MRLLVRHLGFVAILVLGLFAPGRAGADPIADFYHGRTIRLMIGASAGGGYDLVGRVVASRLAAHIPGNPAIVVDNIPAAAGLVMTNTLYNTAPRDGTAIGLPTNAIPLEPQLKLLTRGGGNASFDIGRFGWIGSAAQQPQVLFVWHDVPVKTAADLKTTPVLMGALGVGSDSYTLPQVMNAVMDAKMKIIPGYEGFSDTLVAMERGEIQGHSAGLANLMSTKPEWLRDGMVRILIQFGRERLPQLPDVPTAAELATDDLDRDMLRFYALKYDMAYTLITPPGVSPERLAALRTAFDDTMKDPEYIAAAKKISLPINPLTGDEVANLVAQIQAVPENVVERMREILDAAGQR